MLSLDTSPPSRSDPPRTWVTYLTATSLTSGFVLAAYLGPIHYLITETIRTFHPFLYPSGLINALIETIGTSIVLAVAGIGIPMLLSVAQGAVDELFLSTANQRRTTPIATTHAAIGTTILSTAIIAGAQLPLIRQTPAFTPIADYAIPKFTLTYGATLLLPVAFGTIWLLKAVDEETATDTPNPTATGGTTTTSEGREPDAKRSPAAHSSGAGAGADSDTDDQEADRFDWSVPRGPGFEKIGGYDDVKEEVRTEVIDAVHDEDGAYERMGVSPPTGILLHGPPGTGKSLFGRALAEELGVPFTELSQADLSSKWVNETPELIKTLFDEATSFDKAVVFIDEIDGLLRERNNQGTAEDAKGVNEFLPRLAENEDVIVVAATNRKDVLDDAAIRSGRFDLKIEMGLPDQAARERILEVHLEGRANTISQRDVSELAMELKGKSGADIEEVVKSAARRAAAENSNALNKHHLESQINR